MELTRRQALFLAAALPLRASSADFWNRKPPSQWTSEEIDRLIAKSPWAKEVRAQYAAGQAPTYGASTARYPGAGTGTGTGTGAPTGRPRIGGLGIPGIGGIGLPGSTGTGRPRNTGGSPRGGATSAFEATVRWESALPILDAMKSSLPEAFEGHYVISVTGIAILTNDRTEDDDDTASRRREREDLDRLKSLSALQLKGKDTVRAALVTRQVSSGSSFLFGFSKDTLPLTARDGDLDFTTQLGRLVVKARFSPKDMLYHGELAV
jgi:hypothetical protein